MSVYCFHSQLILPKFVPGGTAAILCEGEGKCTTKTGNEGKGAEDGRACHQLQRAAADSGD